MTCYSVQLRDRIFVKGDGFLSFVNEMGKNIGKNISKNLTSKHNQKILDPDKQSATVRLKLLQKGRFKKQRKQLMI